MPPRRYFTLKQAVEAVLQDSDSDSDHDCVPEICILPPNDGLDSEVEAIDEDDLAPVEPPDVCGELEVFNDHDDRCEVSPSAEEELNEAQTTQMKTLGKTRRKTRSTSDSNVATCTKSVSSKTTQNTKSTAGTSKRKQPVVTAVSSKRARSSSLAGDNSQPTSKSKWNHSDAFTTDIPHSDLSALINAHLELASKTPIEMFETLISVDFFEYMKEQFELYAGRDKNMPLFETTVDEIRKFVGILMLSGYHSLPFERDYWSTAEDLGCEAVKRAMSRNRFQLLKKFCHIADNCNLSASKVAKVQPLYDHLNTKLLQFGIFHEKLSIDESMVPYFGHHGAKMFIRGKPIRFGYKVWMLCSSDGYPYQATIYCGKSDRPESRGLGEHVVLSFVEKISAKSQHELYFDNFFTSYNLMCQLRDVGMRATGTAREGRLGNAVLASKRNFDKSQRGKFEHTCDGKVCIVRWSDNNVVTCMSNFDHVYPTVTVQRHVKGNAEKSKVQQPRMICNYSLLQAWAALILRTVCCQPIDRESSAKSGGGTYL